MKNKFAIIVIAAILLIPTGIIIVLDLKFNSMTAMNVIPPKQMDGYMLRVYGEGFTYLSQTHHYATNYHIWTLTYRDPDGYEFEQYYYINTPETQRSFSEVADYAAIWDTYAVEKIKMDFAEMGIADIYEDVAYDEMTILPEEGCPYCHFNFRIDNEEKLKKTARCLSAIYQRLYEITDTPTGRTLICEIYSGDEILSFIDPNDLAEDIGSALNEYAFYQYLKSLQQLSE